MILRYIYHYSGCRQNGSSDSIQYIFTECSGDHELAWELDNLSMDLSVYDPSIYILPPLLPRSNFTTNNVPLSQLSMRVWGRGRGSAWLCLIEPVNTDRGPRPTLQWTECIAAAQKLILHMDSRQWVLWAVDVCILHKYFFHVSLSYDQRSAEVERDQLLTSVCLHLSTPTRLLYASRT